MRKVLFIILITILSILSLNIIYWEFFIYRDSNNNVPSKGSSELLFTSLYGEYNVFIDEKLLGKVNDKDSKIFQNISSGVRNIRIERINYSVPNFYYILKRDIMFEPNVRVEIKWESGPTLESSRGIIKYFLKKFSPNGTEVVIKPFWPQTYAVQNNQVLSDKVLLIDKPEILKFNVLSNDNSFEVLEVELTIKDQFDEIPKNLQLIVEVYAYKNPIKLN